MFTVLQMSGFQKYIVNRKGDEFLTYISYFKNRLVGNLFQTEWSILYSIYVKANIEVPYFRVHPFYSR